MQDKYIIGTVGIAAIAAMETAAILMGIDGAYLTMCVGAIAGIIGTIAGLTINLKQKPDGGIP